MPGTPIDAPVELVSIDVLDLELEGMAAFHGGGPSRLTSITDDTGSFLIVSRPKLRLHDLLNLLLNLVVDVEKKVQPGQRFDRVH